EGREAAQTGAQRLGLELVILKASTAAEIETAFVAAIEQRASALLASDAYFESQRDQLAALGLRYRLPVCLVSRNSAMAGVLMSYGATSAEILRRPASMWVAFSGVRSPPTCWLCSRLLLIPIL